MKSATSSSRRGEGGERLAADGTHMAADGNSTVSMRFVRGLVEVVEHGGVRGDELLRAAQIDPSQLEAADARLPRVDLHRVFELALDLTGDPALGLRCAERLQGGPFAPITLLVTQSGSLRQAFECLSRFWRLLSDDPAFEIVEAGNEATVRCLRLPGESARLRRFSSEMRVGNYFRVVRLFGPEARPERACFEYAAPPYRSEYARVFENTERFDEPFTGIVFDRALLDVPSPHTDQELHEALQTLAERRILRLRQRMPYALRVRELLVRRGSPRQIDMDTAARSLGISARSLRRRLAAERTSYQAVENEALAFVAKQLLCDEQRTIQETAYELGFSDTSTFHRAFKRWTGTTPSAFRESR